MSLLPITWQTRGLPLTPQAVAAQGTAMRLLAERLLARNDAELALLSGVAGPQLLIVLGPEALLPWVDGAFYLGQDPDAPNLLLPTTLVPSVPLPLLERALQRQVPHLAPPLAVLPESCQLVSLAAARAVARETLVRRLVEEKEHP
jgi:hypothetical protein